MPVFTRHSYVSQLSIYYLLSTICYLTTCYPSAVRPPSNNNSFSPIHPYKYTSGSFRIISVIPCASSGPKSSFVPVGFSGYRCPDIHTLTVYPSSLCAVRSIPLQNGWSAVAPQPPLNLYRQSETLLSNIPSSTSGSSLFNFSNEAA